MPQYNDFIDDVIEDETEEKETSGKYLSEEEIMAIDIAVDNLQFIYYFTKIEKRLLKDGKIKNTISLIDATSATTEFTLKILKDSGFFTERNTIPAMNQDAIHRADKLEEEKSGQ